MNDPKLLLFVILSVGSTLAVLLTRNKPWQGRFLERGVVTASVVKLLACVLVYALWPTLIQHSDARQFYLSQTLRLLDGQLPNRDFASSYSVLFVPLLAIPVKLWPSVGAIVLTMVVAEAGMLIVYLRYCRRRQWKAGWTVAFLYTWSPISCYWVAMSGHNGILIAFWVMVALILADGGRSLASGVAGAMAFLTTKLLAVLAWPALALYRREGWVKRMVPLAVSITLVAALAPFGMDFFSPIGREMAASTTGNLWSIAAKLFGGSDPTTTWPYLPVIAFGILFVPMGVAFMRRREEDDRFDRAVAFVAATNLLFLVLSKKAFSPYAVMALVFVVHAVIVYRRRLVPHLLVLAFVGTASRFEEIHGWDNSWLVVMEVLRIASYGYLLSVCLAVSVRRAR